MPTILRLMIWLEPYHEKRTCARWSANEKSMIDLQKSNVAPYQNAEQEWTKLLIKQYNLHETNDFTYQM